MMLWRGRHLIVLSVVSMLVVAAVAIFAIEKSYEATTLLRIDQAALPTNGSDAYNAQQASAAQAVGYATQLTSDSFLLRLAPKIDNGSRYTGARLARHISAHAIKDTNLIAVTFAATSRKDALHYAGTVAHEAINAFNADFVATRTGQQASVQASLTKVTSRIATLQATTTPAAQQEVAALTIARANLTRKYGELLSEGSTPSAVILMAGPPSAPGDPVSPRPLLYLIIALFLGLLVGLGLAWLRERLTSWDRRTSSSAQALTCDPLVAPPAPRAARRRKANP